MSTTHVTIDFTTPTDYITARPCPFCSTPMERHGRAWVCPVARTEARRISDEQRASVRSTAEARVAGIDF